MLFINTSLNADYIISDLIGKNSLVLDIVDKLLSQKEIKISDNNSVIEYKPALIILIVNTNQGKKFLKLHNKGLGSQEYNGALFLDNYLPVITPESLIVSEGLELIVTPYYETIQCDGGMFFDHINLMDESDFRSSEIFWKLFHNMLSQVLHMTSASLEFCSKPVLNDRLYFDRLKNKKEHQQDGRLETFYNNSSIHLPGLQLPWNELLDKKWIINGVIYKESIRDLIIQAKSILNPSKPRFIGICHGDWHDMNIHTPPFSDCLEKELVFLDCELSGENEVIGDAMVYLVYNIIQGDYLTPKYHPIQFLEHQRALKVAIDNFPRKIQPIKAILVNDYVCLEGLGAFGTIKNRKTIANKFVYNYFNPLIDKCFETIPELESKYIEQTLKSCLLMRLLAVYNLSQMEPLDQAKILGFLIKVIGTPMDDHAETKVLEKILQNI